MVQGGSFLSFGLHASLHAFYYSECEANVRKVIQSSLVV